MEKYDFKEVEKEISEFWEKNRIYEKVRENNKGKKKFYFLDGPPYTSGKVHVGTAWNKSLKDFVLRYKRFRGFDVWDRAGYDMHGLPTAQAVQKKLGLKHKEDIIKFGLGKFIEECKRLCIENMEVMNEDFKRLGVWMDFDNAYQSIKPEFISAEWWLVKKAHEAGRLYEGLKTMTWCGSCGTALAKHECEYENVTDRSIFVKFKVEGEENKFLIIWTTTPWTIPFNLGVMANPDVDYVTAEVNTKTGVEKWVVAEKLSDLFIKGVADYDFKIVDKYKGEKLAGLKYVHPFAEEVPQYKDISKESKKLHTVLLSKEYVDDSSGSGLVHCAPGCGPEDYEVGHANGLPPFNTLDERGVFREIFEGKVAKKDDKFFIELLDRKGVLIASTPVEHEYPHCWRCHNPVVFRTTKQWFFKVEDMKKELVRQNNGIKWVPKSAYNAFDSWLNNLRDNSITKQRFWGCPLPVWKCGDCGKYEVVGSVAELREKTEKEGKEMPKDLHKPWIDEVEFKCSCGSVMKRIPDVLDVWVDAGTTSWNCLNYPSEKENFERLFPADFILEGKDQIRGWFNLLHVCSNIAFGKECFKNVYMHGFINDSKGRKMSKSLQNYIVPEEVIGKYGADTFRYYMIGAANPGLDMNYNMDDTEIKYRNLLVIWNLHNFVLGLAGNNGLKPRSISEVSEKELGVEEKYMLSFLNTKIKEITEKMDSYLLNEVPALIESVFLELSRTYVQFVREKAEGSPEGKQIVLDVCFEVFRKALVMFSTLCPFFSEKVYQNLGKISGKISDVKESVFFEEWPVPGKTEPVLEKKIGIIKDLTGAVLGCRDKAGIGVRWPLKKVEVSPDKGKEDEVREAVEECGFLVKRMANVKEVGMGEVEVDYAVKPNYQQLGKDFGQETSDVALTIKGSEKEIAEQLKEGKEEIIVGSVALRREHLVVERVDPEGVKSAAFGKGFVYLFTEQDEDLLREGFLREFTRRVQDLRKKAGLNKKDVVDVFVEKEEVGGIIEQDREKVKEKISASSIKVVDKLPELKNVFEGKIKGKFLKLGF